MNSAEKTVTLLKLLGQKPYVHGVTELGEKIECTKSGTYKLIVSAFVAEKKAEQPLNIHGSWECEFTR